MHKIIDTFFEDDNENISFFYTGRDNTIGLKYPDAPIINHSNYQFMRIAQIIPSDIALATELITIDEIMSIVLSSNNEEDDKTVATNVYIHGMIKNRQVIRNTFKCITLPITTPEDNEDMVKVYLVKEPINGLMTIGVWIKTEGYRNIFVNKTISKAQNSTPINSESLDSLYQIKLLSTDEIEFNVNVSNNVATLDSNKAAVSVGSFDNILERLNTVEQVAAPKFQYGYIIYPEDFLPSYNIKTLQVLPPRSINYTTNVPFLKINVDRNSVSTFDEGLFQFSLTTGVTGGAGFTTEGDIEIALYINDDIINPTMLKKNIKDMNGNTLTSAIYMQKLAPSDKISIKFKFGDNIPDSISFYNTYLSVLQLQ